MERRSNHFDMRQQKHAPLTQTKKIRNMFNRHYNNTLLSTTLKQNKNIKIHETYVITMKDDCIDEPYQGQLFS